MPHVTEQMRVYIRTHYETERSQDMAHHLGITASSVYNALRKEGLVSARSSRFKSRRWTQDEVNYLIENYGDMTAIAIGRVLGRTEYSMRGKIEHLGFNVLEDTVWDHQADEPPLAECDPCDAPIGSADRVEVLRGRLERGEKLYHEEDSEFCCSLEVEE